MAECEYSILIVHNDREVKEDLIDLFDGTASLPAGHADMDIQPSEYVGRILVHVAAEDDPKGEYKKLFIHTAASSQEYRMLWRDYIHHVILLSLSLPEDPLSEPRKETGMDLLREIKRERPDTEVIVFTDQMVANRAIEAVRHGAFYFIQQPQIYLEFVQTLVARIIQMMEGAYLDTLTGLYNTRFFRNSLKNFWEESTGSLERSRRNRSGDLSLILMDLDKFKAINDGYGHHGGDMALIHVARVMAECFRKTDVMGRIGGDEFAVIAPYTDHRSALEAAERMRRCLAVRPLPLNKGGRPEQVELSVSAGVATYPVPNQVQTRDAFKGVADKALYHAKQELKGNAVCGYAVDGAIISHHAGEEWRVKGGG